MRRRPTARQCRN